MKSILLIMEILTGLLFFATLVCGLWLRNFGEVSTEDNKDFHMLLGSLSPPYCRDHDAVVLEQIAHAERHQE